MRKKRILFVDDDPVVLRSLATMLHRDRTRWEMVFVHGGVAGAAALSDSTFDVLVTDFAMPELDGVALLAAAKLCSPTTVRIMLTGSTVDDLAIDASAVLAKPCDHRELRELLERVTASE